MSLRRKRQQPERDGSRAALTNDDNIEMKQTWNDEDDDEDRVDYGQDNLGADLEEEVVAGEVDETGEPDGENEDKKEGKLRRFLGKIWKTQLTREVEGEINEADANELVVISSFRELGIYMGFVIILCVMTFGITSQTTFYFTKTMADLFVNGPGFYDYTMMKDFWSYAEKPLMNALYWDKYYTDAPVPEDEQGYVLFANKLLGSPRLRQVRVSNKSCTIAKDFRGAVTECFAPYSSSAELKEPFGLKNGTAWNFQSAKQLKGRDTWGTISSYSGGGYVQLLGTTRENATARLRELKENLWIDQGTRAVFIDFTVYNANVNLFCVITLIWEFPATGGLLPNAHFKTLKLLRYVTTLDTIVFGFEVAFLLYLFFYTVEEIIELCIHGRAYFGMDMWNYFDSILLIFGFITIFFTFYVYFEVKDILRPLLEIDSELFANFTTLASYQQLFNQFSAIFVFLAWVKIFKFMTFNKTMTLLQTTLSQCAKDILGFAVMFFIVFLAYAQWGYLVFGTQVYDFSSYHRAIYTLFRVILGDFDFPAMEEANRIIGPIYFITYVFFVFFILINMFLAIINDTYAEVKEDLFNSAEFYLGDYFKKGYNKVLSKLKLKRENIADIQMALAKADSNDDHMVDFEEWKAELKARGHDDDEIEAVFKRYDLDGDRVLNMSELMAMNENLAKEQAELSNEMKGIKDVDDNMDRLSRKGSSIDSDSEYTDSDDDLSAAVIRKTKLVEFEVLTQRVDRIQTTVGCMVSKIDSLLMKIDAMNTAKEKRRHTMNRMLDTIAGESGKSQADDRRLQMEKLVHDELEKWDTEMDMKDEDEEELTPSTSPKTKKKDM